MYGVAVEELRFSGAGDGALDDAVREARSAVLALVARAEAEGWDRSRIVLVGYGEGATVASRMALDRGSVAARVVGLRGTYDSAIAFARADAPPFLLLSGADDAAELAQSARRFARALEAVGARHVETYVVPRRDERTLVDFSGETNPVANLVVSFVVSGPSDLPFDGPWGVRQKWGRAPPLRYDAFRASGLATSHRADERLRAAVVPIFGDALYELHPWPFATYESLSVRAWLASRPASEVGTGDHLIVRNVRGEQLYLERKDIEREDPRIVIGIDGERNLFRMFTSYRMKLEYSWKPSEAPMPLLVRPVGPFLFFPYGAPQHLRDTTTASFGLTPDGFHLQKDDSLAAVRALSPELREALLGGDGCLKCHSLRGTGAHAHHLRASDGKPQGGHALAIDEYPPDVLRRFLFQQTAVAESFGVEPLPIAEPVARALFALAQK
jgi:hypothetical protein